MNKQVLEGGAPSKVEPTTMSKRHDIANVGTPIIENRESAFNPCFVVLGLHIQVPKQNESDYCQRPRCKKHREFHPDKKHETQLEFVKSWKISSPRSSNEVKVAIYKCPRCEKNVRRYPNSGRDASK